MKRLVALILGLAVVTAGCGSDTSESRNSETTVPSATTAAGTPTTTPPDTTGPDGSAAEASWTVLVYVIGDTNLEPFALQDIAEMAGVGSTDDVNIVALVDRHPAYSDVGLLGQPDWEDTRLFLVGADQLTQLGDGSELNMGSPETLASFIEEGVVRFPARRYALVMWDHGAGWPGMGPDETDGLDVLDLADLDAGLTAGIERAGIDRLDLIGFDACLMATYEVASVMAQHADFMLASEELEPGHGWDYRALGVLLDDPSTTPVVLGEAIIEGFGEQATVEGTGQDITLSLLDLSRVGPLQQALADLAAPMAADPALLAPLLGKARGTTIAFGRDPDPELDTNMVDLGLLLDGLAEGGTPGMSDAATRARSALDGMVVASLTGPATARATGMAVYFPAIERHFSQGYLFLEGVPAWPGLLSTYFQAGAAIPAAEQPVFFEGEDGLEWFFDQDGLNVFAFFDAVAEANVIEATIYYGVLDEATDTVTFLGEEPAELSDDGSGFTGALYDLTVLTLSDGEDSAYAYFALTTDPDTGLAFVDIPLAYYSPEALELGWDPEDLMLSLVVDSEGTVLEETYFVVDASGTFGEITTEPDGIIVPVVLDIDADGNEEWIHTTDGGLWADLPSIVYDFVMLDPGTLLYAELVVTDYGGNSDSVVVVDYTP